MKTFGLLGKTLKHSYSPQIHSLLGDYKYTLFEKSEEEICDFLANGEFDGLNVTIPYKKTVVPYLDALSESAKSTGSVNTIVRKSNGTLFGDNTDVYGFRELVIRSGMDVKGKKAIVLGSGGGSAAVCRALEELGAIPLVISRKDKKNNYDRLSKHRDAKIAVNATPLGMYPKNGESAVDLSFFPDLMCVYDLIYNPAWTALLISAQKRNIPCFNGLYMLVAQAKKSSELFTGKEIPDEKIKEIADVLEAQMKNIVLIGMPGSGKTTVASLLAQMTGREALDCDAVFAERFGIKPSEFIRENGEEAFRLYESKLLDEIGKLSEKIIATGGGAVTKKVNYDHLHQNGTIFWLKRDLSKLATNERPLSQRIGVKELYEKRKTQYELFSDYAIDNEGPAEEAAKSILKTVNGAKSQ